MKEKIHIIQSKPIPIPQNPVEPITRSSGTATMNAIKGDENPPVPPSPSSGQVRMNESKGKYVY
jgi:hypothetical protein